MPRVLDTVLSISLYINCGTIKETDMTSPLIRLSFLLKKQRPKNITFCLLSHHNPELAVLEGPGPGVLLDLVEHGALQQQVPGQTDLQAIQPNINLHLVSCSI